MQRWSLKSPAYGCLTKPTIWERGKTVGLQQNASKNLENDPIILAVGTLITDQSLDEDLFRLVCPSVRLTKLKCSLFLNMMFHLPQDSHS